MALQTRIKRQGVEYIDGGGAASLSIADDMQHYSDLLSASAQSITELMAVPDISSLPKIATALNTAYQNIRWISSDLDKYVRATFEAEGVRIVALPVAKIGGSIVSLNKAIVTMTGQFTKGEVTIASVRKQVKAQAKPIADLLSQFAEEYDMYAGMLAALNNKNNDEYDDNKLATINSIGALLTKFYKDVLKFREITNRYRKTPKSEETIIRSSNGFALSDRNQFNELQGLIAKFGDDLSKFKGDPNIPPRIASAIQSCIVTSSRVKNTSTGSDKILSALAAFDTATERLEEQFATSYAVY